MNLPKYQCLKNFTLGGMGINNDFFWDFSNKFPCIENLEVHACRCLQMLEFSCHSLKSLSLERNTELNEICLDIPNINFFRYKGYVPRLSFTFALGPWTSEITIDMSLLDLGASWFLKFKEFLANFVDSDVSVFLDNIEKVSLFVEETKNDALELPLPGILSMLVGIRSPYLVPKYSIILDALLWGFRPKIFTCYWTSLANSRFAKFAYDKLVSGGRDEEDDHSQKIELWKLHLKGVKVEIFKETKHVLEPEPLDWIALSKLSPIVHAPRRFCFTLDWATSCQIDLKK